MIKGKSIHTPSVIIVGGGFAGIAAARSLARSGVHLNITLISNKSYFEYFPAIYRVVTGAAPIEVCVPLGEMLRGNIDIVIDPIVKIDAEKKVVTGKSGIEYEADFIVLALGSETAYFDIPGFAELSYGFKSVGEALKLKEHIESLFTQKINSPVTEVTSRFQIIIVGAGPSGVEAAGDLIRRLEKLAIKNKIDPSFITIDVIERASHVLPSIHPHASERAHLRLRSLGVNVFLNRTLLAEEIEQVYLKDMTIKSKTVIWTAGTRINHLYNSIPKIQLSEKKRVLVNEYLEMVGFDGVYVVGDGAGTQYSGLAQTAITDGKFVAGDIERRIRNLKRKHYESGKVGYVIPIGHNWALMSFGGIRLYGIFAYWVRHMIDFFYFARILSPHKLFSLFFEGWKYR